MSKRISGASFDTYWGTDLIHVEKLTLDITDNTALAQTKGVPDGYVDGDVYPHRRHRQCTGTGESGGDGRRV
ncbi:hypothetical protein RTE01_21510 [Raoultella terrigena]|nr:hypothetical protein RTE01_21510 [Raoultella terrigena]